MIFTEKQTAHILAALRYTAMAHALQETEEPDDDETFGPLSDDEIDELCIVVELNKRRKP